MHISRLIAGFFCAGHERNLVGERPAVLTTAKEVSAVVVGGRSLVSFKLAAITVIGFSFWISTVRALLPQKALRTLGRRKIAHRSAVCFQKRLRYVLQIRMENQYNGSQDSGI